MILNLDKRFVEYKDKHVVIKMENKRGRRETRRGVFRGLSKDGKWLVVRCTGWRNPFFIRKDRVKDLNLDNG